MPRPVLHNPPNWQGKILLKAIAITRAGVVEAVDVELPPLTRAERATSPPIDFLRTLTLQTLAEYQCEGEEVFTQEFQFKIY